MAEFSVQGKTAIVTGGGSGICLQFAALLLSKGCNVVVGDLVLRPAAEKIYSQFKTGTPRAVWIKTDVRDWDDLTALFEAADREFGDIDIVNPGAGVFEPFWTNFWHPPGHPKSRDSASGHGNYAILDINVTHPIRATQLAISYFLDEKRGKSGKASPQNPKRIVHMASIASEIAAPGVPLYVASKWAISGFVRSMMTLEPYQGIRVNAVAPGIVKTPIWTSDKLAYIKDEEAGGTDRWVTTEEVAGAMLKLIEDPGMVGGSVLEVGAQQTRDIPLFGNPGPSGPGHEMSNTMVSVEEINGWLSSAGWGAVKPA